MVGVAHLRPRSGLFPARVVLVFLIVLTAGCLVAISLALAQGRTSSSETFAFPPFRMVYERTSGNLPGIGYHLEWRGRNDWTERLVRSNGAVSLVTKEAIGDEVVLYGMGATHTYPVGDDAVHVPGVWFRDIVATHPSARETRSENGSITTVRRETPIDIEEWDADTATGIPLGYRQIVDGTVVREWRVVSLVLAYGTVIR